LTRAKRKERREQGKGKCREDSVVWQAQPAREMARDACPGPI
jgi:hypothetical protein